MGYVLDEVSVFAVPSAVVAFTTVLPIRVEW